jgi:tRNA/tmRNA/rRNA uracil-C5-methylase (TrmA/RlmC/RlmD family)
MSGGWKWINIPYEEQLKIKENQVRESLFHLNKLQDNLDDVFLPIVCSPVID